MRWLCVSAVLAVAVNAAPFMFPPPPPPPPGQLPPGFDELLPQEAKDKLMALHADHSLNMEQRRAGIDGVFDELPQEVLAKLPLPPGIERLPEEHKQQFRALHMDRTLTSEDRAQRTKQMVDSLPADMQALVRPPPPPHFAGGPPPPQFVNGFPARPPPGFEDVVGATVYKQLLKVHEDSSATPETKKAMIDQIMQRVPREQLSKLPLPPGFDRLPADAQQRVRAIFTDFTQPWDRRHQLVHEFVKELPREQRRLLRPPPPPGFERLPQDVRERIEELIDSESRPFEHADKVQAILQSLPAELRPGMPPPPPSFGRFPNGMPPPPSAFRQ